MLFNEVLHHSVYTGVCIVGDRRNTIDIYSERHNRNLRTELFCPLSHFIPCYFASEGTSPDYSSVEVKRICIPED